MTAREKIEDSGYEDVVIFENPSYDEAFIGISHDGRAVYDFDKMIEWLVNTEDMSYDEAIEFIDFNTIRSLPYVQESPIVVYGLDG